MAYIPVEKKKSGLGWLIPVALLALLAVGAVWLIAELTDDEVEEVETAYMAPTTETTTTTASVPTTTSSTLMLTPVSMPTTSVSDLVGRSVNVDNMKVTRVVGDKSFYVVPTDESSTEEIFVYLDEVPTPDTPTEGRYDVNAGDKLTIMGTIKRIKGNKFMEKDDMLTKKEMESMSDDVLYFHADKLKMSGKTALK